MKDKCVTRAYFPAENPYSVVIAKSEFSGLIPTHGAPSSLLLILREQFPKGTAKINRSAPQGCNNSQSYEDYIEVTFKDEFSRQIALMTPFQLQGRWIKVHRTINVSKGDLYQVFVSGIQLLDNPSTYWQDVFVHLEKFGTVDSLHLHSTDKGVSRHNGDGCAMLFTLPDRIKDISNHPILKISYRNHPLSS
ncbi:hypothetical protein BD408DRAFT_429832 [Parasitella parasitica]|nr:hypothetical protein BD408DRAFT_429832 [Parasitella parasitica]